MDFLPDSRFHVCQEERSQMCCSISSIVIVVLPLNALIENQILWLKCHCNEKIFDPILNTTEQHFHTSLNGVFGFSISCFVVEILKFFETCKLCVSDVIYSRIINYIYQMVNISVNSRQKLFKLCMTIAIW